MENENLIAFYKWDDDKTNQLLIIISLDSHHTQQGMLQLPMAELGISPGDELHLRDLITKNEYQWYDEWNFIELNPTLPFHIFKLD